MIAPRIFLIAAMALLAPASGLANAAHKGKAKAHRSARHVAHRAPHRARVHRHSVHRSAPRRHVVHRRTVRRPAVRRHVVRHVTRIHRRPVATRYIIRNRYVTRYGHRRGYNHHRRYYSARHSYYRGRYRYRSSGYSRRHLARGNRNAVSVVRGVVNGATGIPGNGSIQIKVVNANAGRFRFGAAVAVPNKGPMRTYRITNATRFSQVTNALGATRQSNFNAVKPGEAVIILTRRNGNNLAQAVEIFP